MTAAPDGVGAAAAPALVLARGLSVRYGSYEALREVDFALEPGGFLALVGPNGSGKSTLVRALLGLVEPAAGEVLLHGKPPAEALREFPVGYLPQKSSYADPRFPATAREVVASGQRGRKPDPRAVEEAMRLLRVEGLARRRVGSLSGGQQQRVHLARALVDKPSLLVLDEPTGALDPESRGCFYETLAELNEGGVAILIVSHDLEAVGNYARSLLYLDRSPIYFGSVEGFGERAPAHYFAGEHHHGPVEAQGLAKGACRADR